MENLEFWAVYIRTNPTNVAIVVQVVSHFLGLVQMQAIFAIVRCTFISSINSRRFSLHAVQWVHAATTPKLSFTMPWILSGFLILPLAFSFLPAAVWSGAITPLQSVRNTTRIIQISTYKSANTSSLFEAPQSALDGGSGGLGQEVNRHGVFTFDPAGSKGTILNAASAASTTNSTGYTHAKLDKTGYVYSGRSYGVGSSAGIVDTLVDNSLWYTYKETTFAAHARCSQNESIAFGFTSCNDHPMYTCSFGGVAPNYQPLMGGFITGWLPSDLFAWGISYDNQSHEIYLAAVAGAELNNDQWKFADFNATQCRIGFTPQQFEVNVDNVNRIITANMLAATAIPWPDYTDAVMNMLASWISGFSSTDGAAGGSALGRSLRVNTNQLMESSNDRGQAVMLRAMQDYIQSLIDDTMVALGASRIVLKDATESADAVIGVEAIQIGRSQFIVAMFVFNCLLCIIYLVEALRTSFWHTMSPFDLMDMSSIIIGSLKGGFDTARTSPDLLSQYARGEDLSEASDEKLLKTHLRLKLRAKGCEFPALVAVPLEDSIIDDCSSARHNC